MNIYLQNETDFSHNGLGFLTDIINSKVEDNLNGDYSLFFEYKINGHLSEYLQNENIVKCIVSDGTKQLFVIKNVSITFDSIQVNCKHIFYILLDNFLEDVAPTKLSPQPFLTWILERTKYSNKFKAYSDISNVASARYVRKNPIEAILGSDNSMVNLFNGELKRDNFNIYFNKKIGVENGVKLVIGKNITGINISTDTNSVHTRIMPQGYDGLFLPEKYVDSPLINSYNNPKIYKVEFSDIKYDPTDENSYNTLEDAYEALRSATNNLFVEGIDKPTINVKVDWIELSKTNEYKNYSNLEKVNIGDTITIDLLGLSYQTRVIKTIYNPLIDKIESFELGTPKANITNTTLNLQKKIDKMPNSILENAKNEATKMLTEAMGGYVYKTNNELFIMDTNDPNTATKIWRWNMNGLGYSSNGIDGPYETAMTSDGKIVADFISTGKLNTNVIEGYDSLLLKVSEIADLTRELSSNRYVEVNDAIAGNLISLTISGEMSILPSKNIYPSENLFPHDAFYLKVTNGEESIRYKLPFYVLHRHGDVKDEFIIDNGKTKLIKRIGVDKDDNKYVLTNPIEQTFDDITIPLTDGYNKIELVDFSNAMLNMKYAIQSEYSNVFATKAELSSSITQTKDEINLEVKKKVDDDEIISTINQSAEQVKINANKISLEGKQIDLTSDNITIKSTNFKVDKDGKIEATDGIFKGKIEASDGNVGGWNINSDGLKKGNIFIKNSGYANVYTAADIYVLKGMILGEAWASMPTAGSSLFNRYDINKDGRIDITDLQLLSRILELN